MTKTVLVEWNLNSSLTFSGQVETVGIEVEQQESKESEMAKIDVKITELAGQTNDPSLIFGGRAAIVVEFNNDCAVINSVDVENEIVRLENKIRDLRKFRDAYPGTEDMWLKGVSFIRDSFFVHHAKIIAADASDMSVWPLQHINWVDAVEAFKTEHISIDYNGVKYWVKKPI
jgi:hypothetical protein